MQQQNTKQNKQITSSFICFITSRKNEMLDFLKIIILILLNFQSSKLIVSLRCHEGDGNENVKLKQKV